MIKQVSINDYLTAQDKAILLDARSEGEFMQGHIPGAISFPILNNEERKLVGTCYKTKGHQEAVILGYELVGPKFKEYVGYAYKKFPSGKIYIHCWRGGLRSQIMGNLLSSAGFQVHLIKGGYKTFRATVLEGLNQEFNFEVLGGNTGSGKTEILKELSLRGAQVLDLEGLANHRGSSFGNINMPLQISQEQFENDIYTYLNSFDFNKPIWIEDESRLIGKFQIPNKVYEAIRKANVHFLTYAFEKRADFILKTYGTFNKEDLAAATLRIKKRLGDMVTRQALAHLEANEMKEWVEIVLKYYDKQYANGLSQRDPNTILNVNLEGEELMKYLLAIKS